MSVPIGALHADPTTDWGTYVEGRRLEVERGPWAPLAAEGRPDLIVGPPLEPEYRCIVQRDEPSPHPITWRSKAYALYDHHGIRDSMIVLQQADYRAAGRDPRLVLPHVTGLAFDRHMASSHGGSVAECRDGGSCIDAAIALLRDVLDDADLLRPHLRRLQ